MSNHIQTIKAVVNAPAETIRVKRAQLAIPSNPTLNGTVTINGELHIVGATNGDVLVHDGTKFENTNTIENPETSVFGGIF